MVSSHAPLVTLRSVLRRLRMKAAAVVAKATSRVGVDGQWFSQPAALGRLRPVALEQ